MTRGSPAGRGYRPQQVGGRGGPELERGWPLGAVLGASGNILLGLRLLSFEQREGWH